MTAWLNALISPARPCAIVVPTNPDGGVARAWPTKVAVPAKLSVSARVQVVRRRISSS
jgi:hypothetical protein